VASYFISYNGVDLSDMIRVRTVESTVLPPRKSNSIDIWERQGSIYNSYKYEEREITVSFLVRAMPEEYSPTFMDNKLTDIKTVFNVNAPKPLYLGLDNKFIYAIPEGDFKMEELRYDCYECEVKFICYDPMYYSVFTMEYTVSNNSTVDVYNNGNTTAYPFISVGVNSNDIGFLQLENLTNGKRLLIGSYPSTEKPNTVQAGTTVINDSTTSTSGWATGTGYVDSGRSTGGTLSITSTGAGLMIGSIGSGDGTWKGVSALKSLREPLTNFKVTARINLHSSGENGDPKKPLSSNNTGTVISGEKITYYQVTASALNVRSGPGTKNSIIGSLKKGEKIYPKSIESGWAKIDYKGQTGYCSASYLQKGTSDSTTTSTVINVMTNQKTELRSAADNNSENSSILATIPVGTTLRVYNSTDNGYYKLYSAYNGKIGYVYSSNVTQMENVYVDYSDDEFTITADDKTGTCELYGYSSDGTRLFKLAMTDDNKYYEFNQPSIRVGGTTILKDNTSAGTPNKKPNYSGNEDQLNITYDYLLSGAVGSWNDFYGELGIQRKDGKWQAWIYKLEGGTPTKKLEFKEQEVSGAPTADLAFITIYMGTQGNLDKACGMAISDINVVTLNNIEPETQNVTQFGMGDDLQIDCYNNRVIYNGKLFYDIDIGSQFIELESGSNNIKLTSDDPDMIATILFNERYL
jgi:predicted phage tail component-like protein